MARIGYARVSTREQNPDLQLDALKEAGCEIVYEDRVSGRTMANRPELGHCLKALRKDDVLVVWRLDRLGRSLSDLARIVGDLLDKEIGFASVKEAIDTTGPAGRLQLHMLMAITEYERELIRERTIAGLDAARARGRVGGRKKALTTQEESEIRTLLGNKGVAASQVAERYGISRSTLYKYAPKDSWSISIHSA